MPDPPGFAGRPQRQRPYVVANVAISLDGATTGFEVDVGRYYELARIWQEDVTLTGADTILAQEQTLRSAPGPGPAPDGPMLAVVDGRARVQEWQALRDAGYWREVVALRCATSPRPDLAEVEKIHTGADRVDLPGAVAALTELTGAAAIRVDSGGSLLGAMLDAHLVDEVSLLLHPCWSEGTGHQWHGSARPGAHTFGLIGAETFDQLVWLRYRLSPEISSRGPSQTPSRQGPSSGAGPVGQIHP